MLKKESTQPNMLISDAAKEVLALPASDIKELLGLLFSADITDEQGRFLIIEAMALLQKQIDSLKASVTPHYVEDRQQDVVPTTHELELK